MLDFDKTWIAWKFSYYKNVFNRHDHGRRVYEPRILTHHDDDDDEVMFFCEILFKYKKKLFWNKTKHLK